MEALASILVLLSIACFNLGQPTLGSVLGMVAALCWMDWAIHRKAWWLAGLNLTLFFLNLYGVVRAF